MLQALCLMVHQSPMSVSSAFRSGSESFVASKYSKCLPVRFLFFMIKIHSGLDTWRKLHLEYNSKAFTFCDRGTIVIFLGEVILPVSSDSISPKVSPSGEKTRESGSTDLC